MRIAVVSDTHGNKNAIDRSIQLLDGSDALIHLGDNTKDLKYYQNKIDIPMYSVRGNCDMGSSEPLERIEEFEGNKFFMTHGHKYNVKFSMMNIKYKGKEVDAKVVMYGHTHIPLLDEIDDMFIMNPGSVGNPRNGRATMGIIEIEDGIVKPSLIQL